MPQALGEGMRYLANIKFVEMVRASLVKECKLEGKSPRWMRRLG
jgi:hypothetical protein